MEDQDLNNLRQKIDEIDKALTELLAERADSTRQIGQYKKSHGLPALDEDRWQTVLSSRLAQAKTLGLKPEFTRELYELIHAYALEIEAEQLGT